MLHYKTYWGNTYPAYTAKYNRLATGFDKLYQITDCIRLKLKYQVLPILREYTEDRIIEVGNIGPDYKNLIDYLRGEDNVLEDAIDEMF